MLNTLKLAFATLAAAGIGGQATTQHELPAKAQSEPLIARAAPAIATTAQDSRKVTINYSGPLEHLGGKLSDAGISFVIDPASVKNKEIMLNIEDRPVSEVMEAIGTALGGRFVRHGNTYAFTNRPGALAPLAELPMKADGFTFSFDDKDMKMLMDGKALDMKNLEKHMKEMETQMKAKALKAPSVRAWVDGKEMDPKKAAEQQEKIMKELKAKGLLIKPGEIIVEGKPLDEKQMKELHKKLSEEIKIKDLAVIPPRFEGGPIWVTPPTERQGIKVEVGEALRAHSLAKTRGFALNSDGIQKVMKLMTAKQWEIQKSKGFLTWRDLSPEQQKALGDRPAGSFTVTVTIDGQTLTIKN